MWVGTRVLVLGGGDLGSGVAHRLLRAGFGVMISELPDPLTVRRTVAFATAVETGESTVEGVMARRVGDPATALAAMAAGCIPVLVGADAAAVAALDPAVIVDTAMRKRRSLVRRGTAPVVIALGPGSVAGEDVDAVIETNRGHNLGRVILVGAAEPDTGVPGEVGGHGSARLLRAPCSGILTALAEIGAEVAPGQVVARVNGEPVRAQIAGVLRGMIRAGTAVTAGLKVGDIDPRARPEHCYSISDKARAVAGGVLEAIMLLLCARTEPAPGGL